jgi:site-specific DNA-methyltransferase (adenine-specific)/adenine-specific DNA-methyltransferase
MRELLADQRGPNRFGTRDKIKLVYIDPPFATRQDFMKDKEKAYRDKVAGAKFLEFLRRRLILLRELLAADGSIFVHITQNAGTVPGYFLIAGDPSSPNFHAPRSQKTTWPL